MVLVQGGVVHWARLSHLYYLVLDFLIALLKHGNELSLELQIASEDGLHLQLQIGLQLKVRDYLGRPVVVLMHHMNELVLNLLLLIRVTRLLRQPLHPVDHHYGDKHPAEFELSLTLPESFGDLQVHLAVTDCVLQVRGDLGALLGLAQQILHRLLAVDVLHVGDLVLLLEHVLLPGHVLILGECLCERFHERPLVDHQLCHLLLQLLVLQLDRLYDGLLVRELSPDVLVLRLQLAVDLLDVLLELLEPLVLPLEVALQLPQLLLPEPLLLLDLLVVVPVRLRQLLLQLRQLRLLDALVLELEVEDVRDVPDHRGQLNYRVVLVRREVELELHVQRLGQLLVVFKFVADVVQQVVGLYRQLVVVLLQLLVRLLLSVQLVFQLLGFQLECFILFVNILYLLL